MALEKPKPLLATQLVSQLAAKLALFGLAAFPHLLGVS